MMLNSTIQNMIFSEPGGSASGIPDIRLYFGVFLSVFCSLGVLLNVSAIALLLRHTRMLARNQRVTVLNVAFCDLGYALIGVLVSFSMGIVLFLNHVYFLQNVLEGRYESLTKHSFVGPGPEFHVW